MQQLGLNPAFGFTELYGFDEELLAMVPQPVKAVILNAEQKKKFKEAGSLDTQSNYYMKQTANLDNACGVIACLHSILNLGSECYASDSILDKFQKECAGKTPAERATFMETYTEMQE